MPFSEGGAPHSLEQKQDYAPIRSAATAIMGVAIPKYRNAWR
jgi:hypothetical protein